MSLLNHTKGYRFLRVGETIQAGDLMPDGPAWQPVADHLIGTAVLGVRWSGGDDGEQIIRPRKRRVSKAEEQKILARRAIGA